jgi:hypothetical protein
MAERLFRNQQVVGSIPTVGPNARERQEQRARAAIYLDATRARSLADQATVFETVLRKFDSCRARTRAEGTPGRPGTGPENQGDVQSVGGSTPLPSSEHR